MIPQNLEISPLQSWTRATVFIVSLFTGLSRRTRSTAKKIYPEDYILSVLSPEDRLDAAFQVEREAFRSTKLTMRDIDRAVNSVRGKAY
jgi:hypothetical protein